MAKIIWPDLTDTYEARYPRKPKDVREAIQRAAKHAGVVLESNAEVRARQEAEYKRVMEEREAADAKHRAWRKTLHEINTMTTVGYGTENRFTEPVNDLLPKWVRDIVVHGVDRRGVFTWEDQT